MTTGKNPQHDWQNDPAKPSEAENRRQHGIQWFQQPMDQAHQQQDDPNQRCHPLSAIPSGITAPRRNTFQRPEDIQVITVLACPERGGQG